MSRQPPCSLPLAVFLLPAQPQVGDLQSTNKDDRDFVQLTVPSASRSTPRAVTSNALLAAIQASPGRIDGPANIYYSHGLNRQRILTLDVRGHTSSPDSILPVSDDDSISLEIEPLSPKRPRRHSLNLTPEEEEEYWKSYDIMEKSLAVLGPNPDIPVWSPKDWAESGIIMSRLTLFERVQLQALASQDGRQPPYDDNPPEQEVDIETCLPKPYRPPRPWEKGNHPPEWIKETPLKKGVQPVEWDPSHFPIHPAQDQWIVGDWDLPDNSGYPRSEINEAITDYLQGLLKNYPVYNHMLGWKNITLPLMDVLRLYYFVKKRIDEFAGCRVPRVIPVCGGHLITKENVLTSLGRRPSWGSDCLETLELAEIYGPLGPQEHPTVVEALNADPRQSMGSVQFLKLLRVIDKEARQARKETTV